MTAREIIRAEYGDAPNFMTPNVIRIGKLGKTAAYELASGSGLMPGSTIYGVSVVRVNEDGTTERDFDASGCYHDLADAEAHIYRLRA